MKRYLIILTLYLCAVVPMMAQYYSVNFDKRTVEAMTAAFATEAATETYYAEQVAKIREHYQAAEVAAAGIFTSKFLDRKALTHLGLWTSATENYYYRRIYNMVSAKIMPKIWTVAGMMLKNPQNALYWGAIYIRYVKRPRHSAISSSLSSPTAPSRSRILHSWKSTRNWLPS